MNRIYKSVWNEQTGAYVAVSENTKTKGKRSRNILAKTVMAGVLGFSAVGASAQLAPGASLNNVANLSSIGGLGGVLQPVLGIVGGVTGGQAGSGQGGLLDPVLNLVGGLTGGQSGAGVGGLLEPVLGLVGGVTGSLGGVGGGSAANGAITDVQGTVDRLVNNTALAPVGGLVNGLVDPQNGALAPVTGLVNDLT
ncbi:MAG: hypothetical protein GX070_10860, partial [Alcaligenaceae bacterium]|nr:hypothetical protein [Alcaligenaceae bacterium]